MTEFAIIPRSTHDVILGMDFLRECGATVDCRTGNVFVSGQMPSELQENPADNQTTLCVCGNTFIPALYTIRVPVVCRGADSDSFDASVEPMHINCVNKNVLVLHCVVSIDGGRTDLWTVKCPSEPVTIPNGLKSASVSKEHVTLSVVVLTDVPEERAGTGCHYVDEALMATINKSFSSSER